MFGDKPVRDELKVPDPVPSDVLVVNVIVGLVLVDQTTPLEVTAAPPSELIFPPVVAEFVVMAVIEVVISVGRETMELVFLMQRTEFPFCFSK